MRLLLVEGDEMLGEPIVGTMRAAGYAIDWARDLHEAGQFLDHDFYDLVILERDAVDAGGGQSVERLRCHQAPVLVLTARDAAESRVPGLAVEEYLLEPFELDELTASVRTSLRRRAGQIFAVHRHGDLSLNIATREAMLEGQPLTLEPCEFSLLQALIEEPTRVFTHRELRKMLNGLSEANGDTLETHIAHLRHKIGAGQIVTVRGVGYRLKCLESPRLA
ncbi:DNA-binding response regulator [Paraburkholderia steynii]|uniref:DNA-binding response regulator n=1 Tax=Paraburkholderia steynii TaxID=1245441 RepID=A0A4R0X3C3_9BURK|nr:DNA-binding response regulator [Paraburkholderia steynii]